MNNVNNGIPRTRGTVGNPPPSTGVLLIRKSCAISGGGGSCPGNPSFDVQVTGNNPNPSSFSLSNGRSQSVTLGSGTFSIVETPQAGFTTSFSGACTQTGSTQATGNIAAGQQQTCTITNTAVPTTGTLVINKVCLTPSGDPCTFPSSFTVQVTGTNPQPSFFVLHPGNSQSVTLSPGSFSVRELGLDTASFTPSLSGDCSGTVASGQHLTCTITNQEIPGTLTIRKVCNPNCPGTVFSIRVQDNELNSPIVVLSGGASQSVTISPGSFSVQEIDTRGFTPSVSGDCRPGASHPEVGFGTIRGGQQLTCTITNSR